MKKSNHYATFEALQETFVVQIGKVEIARSTKVVQLDEFHDDYIFNPVYYFPLTTLDPNYISKSTHQTNCPIKGNATYWNITIGEKVIKNGVWGYLEPMETAIRIKDYIAFDLNPGIRLFKNESRVMSQGFKGKKR